MKPLFALLVFIAPWCNDSLIETAPVLSSPVHLQVGHSAVVEGGTLRFDSVLTDSRCPTGAMCVWAGEAEIRVEWMRATRTAAFVLKLGGGTDAQDTESHMPFDTLGYRFTFQQLDPHPAINIRMSYGAYTATVGVENLSGTVRR